MRARLRVFDPLAADARGVLTPATEWAATMVRDNPVEGTLSLTVDDRAVDMSLLTPPFEVKLELNIGRTGDKFTEPRNGHFLCLHDGQNLLPAADHAHTFALSPVSFMLRKAIVWPPPYTKKNKDRSQRVFRNWLAGHVFYVLWKEAQERDALAGMGTYFHALTDDNGVPWSARGTYSWPVGTTLADVLADLIKQGAVQAWTRARHLHITNAGATQNLATIQAGRDVTSIPRTRDWSEMVSQALVSGDNSYTSISAKPGAVTPWGRWETSVNVPGERKSTRLQTAGRQQIQGLLDAKLSTTAELVFSDDPSAVWPLRDYQLGDALGVKAGNPYARYTVEQITLHSAGQNVAGNVVLGDRRAASKARRVGAGSGGPIPPSRPPAHQQPLGAARATLALGVAATPTLLISMAGPRPTSQQEMPPGRLVSTTIWVPTRCKIQAVRVAVRAGTGNMYGAVYDLESNCLARGYLAVAGVDAQFNIDVDSTDPDDDDDDGQVTLDRGMYRVACGAGNGSSGIELGTHTAAGVVDIGTYYRGSDVTMPPPDVYTLTTSTSLTPVMALVVVPEGE